MEKPHFIFNVMTIILFFLDIVNHLNYQKYNYGGHIRSQITAKK